MAAARTRPRWERRTDRRAERGDTLIELLISIVVLSVGVIGVFSVLAGSLATGDMVRARADTSQLVTRVGDELQRAEWECRDDPLASYEDLLATLKPTPRWTIRVTAMAHWGRSRSFEDGCPPPKRPICSAPSG